MALSNAPGLWHWEKRGDNWWRVNEELNIESGPFTLAEAGVLREDYVRRLEDACLLLWAELFPDAGARVCLELPALADFLGEITHPNGTLRVRRNVWGPA